MAESTLSAYTTVVLNGGSTITRSSLVAVLPTSIAGATPVACPSELTTIASLCSNGPGNQPIPVTASSDTLESDGTTYVQLTYIPAEPPTSSADSTTGVATAKPSTSTSSSSSSPIQSENSSPSSSSTAGSAAGNSAPTSNSANGSSGGSGLGTGAVAGVAIAGLIAGIIIASIIAFILFKRRARRERYVSRNTYVPSTNPAYGGEKGTPMVSIAPVGGLDFLPQQADDAEVKRKLVTILDQVDQHVENFYGNRIVPLDANIEGDISRFETSELPLPLAACFERTTTPTTLIKHCLAFQIFNLTVAPGEGAQLLLPPELAGLVTPLYHKSLSSSTSKDAISAFSTWKALTKYLRADLGRETTIPRNVTDNAASFSAHFTSVFAPWSHNQFTDEHRSRHLTELINQAIQTAVWLFGQPDNYKFEWDVPTQASRQNANRSVVIVPAVWKTTHNGAKLNGRGQSIVSPVVRGF